MAGFAGFTEGIVTFRQKSSQFEIFAEVCAAKMGLLYTKKKSIYITITVLGALEGVDMMKNNSEADRVKLYGMIKVGSSAVCPSCGAFCGCMCSCGNCIGLKEGVEGKISAVGLVTALVGP